MEATGNSIDSASKDKAHMTPDWALRGERIDGVTVREVKHIVTANGHTTELFRDDWGVVERPVVQMIHVSLRPGALSAWHMHKLKTDHLFVVSGMLKLALYDDREGSPSKGQVDVFHLSGMRPMLVVIPPGVWHGLQTLSPESCSFVNFFDNAYDYNDPDDWRLPPDTDEIPFRF
ncbi:MAG TPA: cupin domain-containing protein [Solirubrobacteraceae bacterium]|nr:cupin domain-containing protein [Solirubrobacteraceae bacterium]